MVLAGYPEIFQTEVNVISASQMLRPRRRALNNSGIIRKLTRFEIIVSLGRVHNLPRGGAMVILRGGHHF